MIYFFWWNLKEKNFNCVYNCTVENNLTKNGAFAKIWITKLIDFFFQSLFEFLYVNMCYDNHLSLWIELRQKNIVFFVSIRISTLSLSLSFSLLFAFAISISFDVIVFCFFFYYYKLQVIMLYYIFVSITKNIYIEFYFHHFPVSIFYFKYCAKLNETKQLCIQTL